MACKLMAVSIEAQEQKLPQSRFRAEGPRVQSAAIRGGRKGAAFTSSMFLRRDRRPVKMQNFSHWASCPVRGWVRWILQAWHTLQEFSLLTPRCDSLTVGLVPAPTGGFLK